MPPKRTIAPLDDEKPTLSNLRKRPKPLAVQSGAEQVRAIAQQFAKNPYGALQNPTHRPCTRSDHVRKKNCTNSPFCLYGLGETKLGIWEEDGPVYSSLGTDLRKRDRRSQAAIRAADPSEFIDDFTQPLGLRNLGATCYLNALMQCLFHNKVFRNAVYETDVSTWGDSLMAGVMTELQKAFAHMQWGYKNVYDLTYFTTKLGLQTQEQQDPQEFNKLFLSKLEETVIGGVGARRMEEPRPACVTDVFRGRQRYVTRCLECFNESGGDTPFYELELPVEGCTSLQQSLDAYLQPEELTGDNQYACSVCGRKTDAQRAAQITEAPEVLLLQLMRYVYDRTTWTKKKLKTEIRFQNTITLGQYEYQLTTILYHKGSTAYGGHYVAEVVDWESERWWMFDDENVTAAERPSSERTEIIVDDTEEDQLVDSDEDSGTKQDNNEDDEYTDSKSSKKRKQPNSKEATNANATSSNGRSKKKAKSKQKQPFNRWQDAYMFAYVRTPTLAAWAKQVLNVRDAIKDTVAQSNVEFLFEYEDYVRRRSDLDAKINHRKEMYNALFLGPQPIAIVEGQAALSNFHLVPTDWLRQWVIGVVAPSTSQSTAASSKSDEPDIVDLRDDEPHEAITVDDLGGKTSSPSLFTEGIRNLQFMCPHVVGLSPNFVNRFKALSAEAYQAIIQGSLPESTDEFLGPIQSDYDFHAKGLVCAPCVQDTLHRGMAVAKTTEDYEQLLSDIERSTVGEPIDRNDEVTYLLSSGWVSNLKKYTARLVRDSKKAADLITQGKTDEKNLLSFFGTSSQSSTDAADTMPLDENVNTLLVCPHEMLFPVTRQKRNRYVTHAGWKRITKLFPHAIELLATADICPTCQAEDEASINLRKKIGEEKGIDMQYKCLQNLLKERRYPIIFERPEFIQNPHALSHVTDSQFYLVEKNWLSLWRHYHNDAHAPSPAMLTNLTLQCQHGHALVSRGITSVLFGGNWIDGDGLPESELIEPAQWQALMKLYGPNGVKVAEEPIEASEGIGEEGHLQTTNTQPFEVLLTHNGNEWIWQPDQCPECIDAAVNEADMQRRTFTDRVVRVVKLKRGQEPPVSSENMGTSRRSTRGASQFTEVTASATDTLALFKLKVFQEAGIEPNRQKLYFNGDLLQNPTRTLAKLGIRANDTMYLQEVSHDEVEDDGVADMWSFSNVNANETGFQGTLLSGGGGARQAVPPDDAQEIEVAYVPTPIDEDKIKELTNMGFNQASVRNALDATGANMDRAVEMLLLSANPQIS